MVDLMQPAVFSAKLAANVKAYNALLKLLGAKPVRFAEINAACLEAGAKLKPFVTNTVVFLDKALKARREILFEGAQGTFLDIDHGTYPYVTSSNTTAGGACTGSGVPPHRIDRVIGVMKAYTTRVGEGPFPDRGRCDRRHAPRHGPRVWRDHRAAAALRVVRRGLHPLCGDGQRHRRTRHHEHRRPRPA